MQLLSLLQFKFGVPQHATAGVCWGPTWLPAVQPKAVVVWGDLERDSGEQSNSFAVQDGARMQMIWSICRITETMAASALAPHHEPSPDHTEQLL